MSAATDRNERHRWCYMSPEQLLRRLNRLTNPEKIQSFIDEARRRNRPFLQIEGQKRWNVARLSSVPRVEDDEIDGMPLGNWDAEEESSLASQRSSVSMSMTTADQLTLEKFHEIEELLNREGMTADDAKKIIEERINKKVARLKSKKSRRKIRT